MGRDGLAILVPVLARPHRVRPLLASIRAATPDARVVFITDADDGPERQAVHDAGAEILDVNGGYATKINAGVKHTDEPLIFTAADDLHFHPGWLQAAEAELQGEVGVVGVNDLIERTRVGRREHATHFLIARWYAALPTIDDGRGPMCELYQHNFVDDELIATARARGAYVYAPNSHVQHQHPMNGTADDDDTYRKGRAAFRRDRRLHHSRARLWA